MSEIDIRRRHALSLPKARQAAERVAKQLEREFALEYRWEGHSLHFRRAGVDGRLTVSAQDIHLHASLGMMLSLLKGRIESKVHEHLDEVLAPPRNVAASKAHKQAGKQPDKPGTKRAARRKA
ncbi:MAG: polyhydroxyalkanoic acid system family protein [Burkholderiales bacterium]|nr:polyhydroxyalkanoic acid system family protein [Burkholderiales bacterium]